MVVGKVMMDQTVKCGFYTGMLWEENKVPKHYWFVCPDCGFETYRYRNTKTCPECGGALDRESPVDFKAACWMCGCVRDLEMLAHRNAAGRMVGWLFVCTEHAAAVADGDLLIELRIDGQPVGPSIEH